MILGNPGICRSDVDPDRHGVSDNRTLQFGQANQPCGSRLLLSGAATFSATSFAFNNTGTTAANKNYISFATGSTATFTASNKELADYQALVANGNIRVDGVVQSDFSKFQVAGHTLSLSTGGPTPRIW